MPLLFESMFWLQQLTLERRLLQERRTSHIMAQNRGKGWSSWLLVVLLLLLDWYWLSSLYYHYQALTPPKSQPARSQHPESKPHARKSETTEPGRLPPPLPGSSIESPGRRCSLGWTRPSCPLRVEGLGSLALSIMFGAHDGFSRES